MLASNFPKLTLSIKTHQTDLIKTKFSSWSITSCFWPNIEIIQDTLFKILRNLSKFSEILDSKQKQMMKIFMILNLLSVSPDSSAHTCFPFVYPCLMFLFSFLCEIFFKPHTMSSRPTRWRSANFFEMNSMNVEDTNFKLITEGWRAFGALVLRSIQSVLIFFPSLYLSKHFTL